MLISKTFLKNVRAAVEHQGRMIGHFEKSCGLSAGYVSRGIKTVRRGLSLETAIKMSEETGYSINDLLKPDFVKEQRIADLYKTIQASAQELKEFEG